MDPDHLHIHVYASPDPRIDEVLAMLRTIRDQGVELMAKYESINALVGDLNTETNRLSQVVADALAQISGGLTPEQADQVIASLTPVRDALRAIGANPADPIPTA